MSQCEIRCKRESDKAFLEDPTVDNAQSAFVDFSHSVAQKASGAAVKYAMNMCSGGSIKEAVATVQAEMEACNGSVASDNVVSHTFRSWNVAEHTELVQTLTG